MIKVSIMYPNTPGVQFDHDYYRDKHLPLIQSRLGADLKYYTIDKGLTGETTPYVAMCHLICDSLEAYRSARAPHAEEIRGDIRNFTNQTPVTQISEVVVENSAIGVDGGLHRNAVDQRSLPPTSDKVSR